MIFSLQNCTIEVRGITEQSIVPAPGDIVTAMVTLVNHRFCKCSIKCVGDIVLTRPYRGILRKEDVKALEKDKIEMYKCYRPGDIILARVVSFKFILYKIYIYIIILCLLRIVACNFSYSFEQMPMTEAHTYQLSTAENELGVVIAHSEEGIS